MLNKIRQSNNKGFTIIEVMIVLAIAGMIILVVLLAVPAVQRSGRNTAMRNDASAVAAAITEYENNNNGTAPKDVATANGTVTVCDATTKCTTTPATAKVQGSTAVALAKAGTALTNPPADPGIGNIAVYLGVRCDTTASPRSTAIVYDVETSGTSAPKCIDS